jgi:hypothetical protein
MVAPDATIVALGDSSGDFSGKALILVGADIRARDGINDFHERWPSSVASGI